MKYVLAIILLPILSVAAAKLLPQYALECLCAGIYGTMAAIVVGIVAMIYISYRKGHPRDRRN